jgi:hypothetical protein
MAILEEPIKGVKEVKNHINGEELVRRVKGRITVDPKDVIEVVN